MKNFVLILAVFFSGFIFGQKKTEFEVHKLQAIPSMVKVQEEAGFPKNFQEFLSLNFQEKNVDKKKGMLSCMLLIDIKKDGSVTNIRQEGFNESFMKEIFRILSLKQIKFIPAQINKSKVDSQLRFNISTNN